MQKIYGNYLNAGDARRAVDELLNQGYLCNQIKVVSNKGLDEDLNCSIEPNIDDRNIWERIKDSFTFEKHNDSYWKRGLNSSERILLKSYKQNLQEGETMILIDRKVDNIKEADGKNLTIDTTRIDESSLEEDNI